MIFRTQDDIKEFLTTKASMATHFTYHKYYNSCLFDLLSEEELTDDLIGTYAIDFWKNGTWIGAVGLQGKYEMPEDIDFPIDWLYALKFISD